MGAVVVWTTARRELLAQLRAAGVDLRETRARLNALRGREISEMSLRNYTREHGLLRPEERQSGKWSPDRVQVLVSLADAGRTDKEIVMEMQAQFGDLFSARSVESKLRDMRYARSRDRAPAPQVDMPSLEGASVFSRDGALSFAQRDELQNLAAHIAPVAVSWQDVAHWARHNGIWAEPGMTAREVLAAVNAKRASEGLPRFAVVRVHRAGDDLPKPTLGASEPKQREVRA